MAQGRPRNGHGGWRRLWRAVRAGDAGCPHRAENPGAVGDYAVLLHRAGLSAAAEALPATAAHLASGCRTCRAHLVELLGILDSEPLD